VSLRPLRAAIARWRPPPVRPEDPLSTISGAWPEIVGAHASRNSVALSVDGATLLVATRSSAWSEQLQLLAPQIIERLRDCAPGLELTEIRFRTGLPRNARSARGMVPRPALRFVRSEPAPDPAIDENEALDRLRRRINSARRRGGAVCRTCGAPVLVEGVCAPCRGAGEAARSAELERLLYSAPWLSLEEVCEFLSGIDEERYERSRRNLLQRWWIVLERARRSRRALSPRERQIASSYVLLQSGLSPERVTPAVVRNLLGEELESQLSEHVLANENQR